ncbi:MAG: U32 family peptidase [Elusimicrobiota bacterium]
MIITAPFDTADEIEKLADAGAGELYCGLYHNKWKKFGIYPNLRHMEYGNLASFKELKKAVEIARKRDIPVYLCVNEFLPEGAENILIDDISEAAKLGVSGFIAADITLVPVIKDAAPSAKIIMSSLNPYFNRMTLALFKQSGVDRVVLPYNQFTLKEILRFQESASETGIETEMFISPSQCRNINGFCLNHKYGVENIYTGKYRYAYRFALSVLRRGYSILGNSIKRKIGKKIWTSKLFPSISCREKCEVNVMKKDASGYSPSDDTGVFAYSEYYSRPYCILCSIYHLVQAGITAGKIEGRGRTLEYKLSRVRSSRMYIENIAGGKIIQKNFEEKGRDIFMSVFGRDCKAVNCYHKLMSGDDAVTIEV